MFTNVVNNFRETVLSNSNAETVKNFTVENTAHSSKVTVINRAGDSFVLRFRMVKQQDGDTIPARFARVSRETLNAAPRTSFDAYSASEVSALLLSARRLRISLVDAAKKSPVVTLSVPASYDAESGANSFAILRGTLDVKASIRSAAPYGGRTAQQITAAALDSDTAVDLFTDD